MRVTKLIREYVIKSVHEAYPMDNLQEYVDVKDRVTKAEQEYIGKLNEFKDMLIKKVIEDYAIPKDWVKKGYIDYEFYATGYGSKLKNENDKHLKEINDIRQQKINEILLNLELGANREELNKMIADLIGGEKE